MKRRFRDYFFNLLLLAPVVFYGGIALAVTAAPSVPATSTPQSEACAGIGGTLVKGACVVSGPGKGNLSNIFKTIANTLIFIVLSISVIMVIIGALRYVLSGGDSAGVKSAKDTILYALIGVGVAIVAYAIVNFVVNAIK